jgi:hypothetical protein
MKWHVGGACSMHGENKKLNKISIEGMKRSI